MILFLLVLNHTIFSLFSKSSICVLYVLSLLSVCASAFC